MAIIMHVDDQMNTPKPWELKRLKSMRFGVAGDYFLIHYVDSKILNIASIASIKEQIKDKEHGMVNVIKITPKNVDISKLIG